MAGEGWERVWEISGVRMWLCCGWVVEGSKMSDEGRGRASCTSGGDLWLCRRRNCRSIRNYLSLKHL